jgi:hypothetical protein
MLPEDWRETEFHLDEDADADHVEDEVEDEGGVADGA